MTISTILLVLALAMFIMDAFSVAVGRVKIFSLGFVFWVAALLLAGR